MSLPVKTVEALNARGFHLTETGGGCIAYERTRGEESLLITQDEEPSAPVDPALPCLLGVYVASEQVVVVRFPNLPALLEAFVVLP